MTPRTDRWRFRPVMSREDVGRRLGIPESTVSYSERIALRKLKAGLLREIERMAEQRARTA